MSMICALRGHRASGDTVRNGAHHFSRCARCGCDLIEADGKWTTAPRGYRITWRSDRGQSNQASPAAERQANTVVHDKRSYVDRRASPKGEPPAFLGGRDRRRARDRRRGFGKRAPLRAETD